ncbi:hypothetical protein C0Q70_04203 [Pomacea canaliculata]|uniref:Uncharacterized protein n=1 Tax=Pomacea canaliculata TaxID=400727 RepID=A0A2T7PUW6_POMCA|nr:hypothetical protein C0Q70_04203 [Pomacea canaliculata]
MPSTYGSRPIRRAESASTNTVIITVVCVVAGVVIVAVVVALVVVFKLRRKSDDKEDVAFIRGGTKPDIPLEPRPATSYSAFDVADNIYSKSRLGKSGNSSNDKDKQELSWDLNAERKLENTNMIRHR